MASEDDYEMYKSLGHTDLLQSLGVGKPINLDQRKLSKIVKGEEGSDKDIFAFFDDFVEVNQNEIARVPGSKMTLDLRNQTIPHL